MLLLRRLVLLLMMFLAVEDVVRRLYCVNGLLVFGKTSDQTRYIT